MSRHRFFLAAALSGTEGDVAVPLSAEDLHHAVSVLRLRAGEEIELAEPAAGALWRARVSAVDRDALVVALLEQLPAPSERKVVLVQGVAKGEKMDLIVRQAVELGATEVIPVITERTITRLDAERRHTKGDRWRRVAKAAAEQSHRGRVPVVHDPVLLSEALPALAAFADLYVMWEDVDSCDSPGFAPEDSEVGARSAVVIGPEGGLTRSEVESLQAIGGVPVSLGDTILRTETAAVVAVALLVHARGGLGGGRPAS